MLFRILPKFIILSVLVCQFSYATTHSDNPAIAKKLEQMRRGVQAEAFSSRPTSQFERLPEVQKLLKNRPQSSLQAAPAGSSFQPFFSAPYVSGTPSGSASPVYTSATADFDRQSGPDIATVQFDGTLNVLFNNGQGNLARTYSNSSAQSLAAGIVYIQQADLNGDGFPDIVAMDGVNSAFLVFLNQKNGTFANATSIPVAPSSGASFVNGGGLIVADVDGNGKPDVVTVSNLHTGIDPDISTVFSQQTFRGNGDGTFQAPIGTDTTLAGYFYVQYGSGIVLADMNRDNSLDLVLELAESDTKVATIIAESRGDGRGNFNSVRTTGAFVAAPGTPESTLQVVDLNGDGSPDALFIDRNGTIYVAKGKTNGSLQPPSAVLSNIFGAYLLGLGDFNQDSKVDLIVYGFGQVAVFPGKGDGTFNLTALGQYVGSFGGDQEPAPADFNRDGNLDFAWVESAYSKVSLFSNRGNGTFIAANAVRPFNSAPKLPNSTEWGGNIIAAAVGDFNGDTVSDALVYDFTQAANSGFADIDFGISDGKGRLDFTLAMPGALVGSSNIVSAFPSTADFNGDRRSDVVFSTTDGLSVALANADGTLQTPISLTFPVPVGCTPIGYGDVGDVNGDGNMDIVAAYAQNPNCQPSKNTPTGYFVFLGDGTGHFTGSFTQFGGALYFVKLSDFNADGKLDMAIEDLQRSGGRFNLYTIPGKGDGTFNTTAAVAQPTQEIVSGIVVGDYNGDGKQDLTLLSAGKQDANGDFIPGTQGAILMPGRGDFTFGSHTLLASGIYPLTGEYADFDHDGNLDLALTQYASYQDPVMNFGLIVLPGQGQGRFGTAANYLLPQFSGVGNSLTLIGDFNMDGAPDVVVGAGPSSALFLNRNK